MAGGIAILLAMLSAWPAAALAQAEPPTQAIADHTGDPLAGRKVARTCGACHGIDGIAKNPEAANLAGQDAGYLTRQLVAFRGGERKNEVMSLMAKNLSDQQIADVTAYYGAIEIQVVKVPGK